VLSQPHNHLRHSFTTTHLITPFLSWLRLLVLSGTSPRIAYLSTHSDPRRMRASKRKAAGRRAALRLFVLLLLLPRLAVAPNKSRIASPVYVSVFIILVDLLRLCYRSLRSNTSKRRPSVTCQGLVGMMRRAASLPLITSGISTSLFVISFRP
jgi:hypothetical protein